MLGHYWEGGQGKREGVRGSKGRKEGEEGTGWDRGWKMYKMGGREQFRMRSENGWGCGRAPSLSPALSTPHFICSPGPGEGSRFGLSKDICGKIEDCFRLFDIFLPALGPPSGGSGRKIIQLVRDHESP